MRSGFFVAVVLAVITATGHAEEQVIPVPDEGWAIRLNAPKLEPQKDTVPSIFYGKADRLQVSLFVEAPRCPGGDSDENIYECFAASLKKNPFVKWDTERGNRRSKGGVSVTYLTQLEKDGKVGSAFNINILFAKKGKWVDLHMSIASPKRDDIDALFAMDDSVTVEESASKKDETPPKKADSSLNDAIKGKNIKEVERLLAAGADPKMASNEMPPPIVLAGFVGDLEIIRALLEHDAPIDQVWSGTTCLGVAGREGYIEAVRFLLSKNANVNMKADDGMTALTETLGKSGSIEIGRLLVEAGADVNAPAQGLTPLIIATSLGKADWVELLLKNGARVTDATPEGLTALDMAKLQNNSKITKLLLTAGAKN